MVKEPRPGRVKTRLGRETGMTTAAWWFRHQSKQLIRRLQDPRWSLILSVSPDYEGLQSRVWPTHIHRIPQGRGDLGDRMARSLRFTSGPSVLIGADIPGVTRKHIAEAFKYLGSAPSVLGPAHDGGFWLVGLRHPSIAPKDIFQNVRWSSQYAMIDTERTLPRPVAKTAMLHDVDTVEDLQFHLKSGACR
ncbi:MAG: DUF2064 domain-containing protein [Boseongicola sp.]|nr:MAG: DUF2064 domain-containing protein [Boseongicola sp.]